MQYYFILGKNPILSKAEIEAVFNNYGLKIKNSEIFDKIFMVETEKELDINWLNKLLGGTVKIGLILGKIHNLESFTDRFFQFFKVNSGKAYYGFSLYSLSPEVHLNKYQKELLPIAMEIKRKLREEKNINSRYVTSKEKELSSVIVKKNKLLQNGAEICFFIKKDEIIFGQTVAVQEFEEFGARDYARPGRDDVSGMLPPKLARIMVNLAQAKNDAIILDPFCGSGTILQEALLMGYKNLIGSDNSKKATEDTKRNLDWLKGKYNLDISDIQLLDLPVEKLNSKFAVNSIDVIITEPYLGPALKGSEGIKQIDIIIKELDALYFFAFEQFKKILKAGGKIIIVFPIFQINNQSKHLAIFDKVQEMGFKVLNSDDLIYWRSKQYIWRDILIFEKI